MAIYYAVERSQSYLKHYGVKGMRWGVRRAKEHKDDKRLFKHWKKANKKLVKLKRKADVINSLDRRLQSIGVLAGSVIPLAGGIGVPILAKNDGHRLGTGDKVAAGFNVAAGAGMLGLGAHEFVVGSKGSKTKGHAKAIKKVNSWQKEMKSAFKGTKYGEVEKMRPKFKDEYTLYEYGTLGKDKNGKVIPYRAPTISIKGSDLVRDSNAPMKAIFKQRLIDPPQTQKMSKSKVNLIVHTPSGMAFTADTVNGLVRVKKKRK